MDTAEWIIAGILSLTLFVFLALAILLLIKLLDLARDAKHIMKDLKRITSKGNAIASDAKETVESVKNAASSTAKSVKKDVTSTSSVVKEAVVTAISKKFGLKNEETKETKEDKKEK